GGFVDGFPMPNEGLHLGGLLGLAGASAKQSGSKYTGFGPGMAAWLGYDGWVADEWSMGGLLKLSGGLTWGKSHDPGADIAQSAATYEVTLLFSVLYH
ncbi:MAG TPA: hypothetical protein VGQ57_19820, partial [Polyangiaceae bacterium]|nr:hypothetical protein [Polyangiaceae bacterium]